MKVIRKKVLRALIIIFILLLLLSLSACSNEKSLIPDGFIRVEDDKGKSLLIEDQNGIRYVWIPTDKLTRYDFEAELSVKDDDLIGRIYFGEGDKRSITKGTENDISFFQKSVKKYGGFYIEQDESKEEGQSITNITREEAMALSNARYQQKDITCTLVNSYAWDTTCLYMREHNVPLKHMDDGVAEYTTEYSSLGFYDDNADVVTRGGSDIAEDVLAETRNYNFTETKNPHTGFRTVIYFN